MNTPAIDQGEEPDEVPHGPTQALGMVETFGVLYLMEAADAMCKAGVKAIEDMGHEVYSHVTIARPHPGLEKIIKRYSTEGLIG